MLNKESIKKRSLLFYFINGLTISRIVFSPIILIFILSNLRVEAFIFFLLAVITDLLDGYLARRFNQCSFLGENLDAIADLSLICLTVIALFKLGEFSPFVEMSIIVIMLMIAIILIIHFVKNGKIAMPNRRNSTTINSYFIYVTLIFFILNSPYKQEVAYLSLFIVSLTILDYFFRKERNKI